MFSGAANAGGRGSHPATLQGQGWASAGAAGWGALGTPTALGAAGGDGSGEQGGDSGRVAQFVSNASFATLALIYSLTELLDLSDQLSRVAGLTARVGQLLEALPAAAMAAPAAPGRGAGKAPPVGPAAKEGGSESEEEEGGGSTSSRVAAWQRSSWWAAPAPPRPRPRRGSKEQQGRELGPSELATLLQPPRLLPAADPGGAGGRGHGGAGAGANPASPTGVELSVHALGPALAQEVRAVFPDAPPQQAAPAWPLLAVITFQFAAGGVSLAPDSSAATLGQAAAEMDRMLEVFLRWQGAVHAALQAMTPAPGAAGPGPGPRAGGATWQQQQQLGQDADAGAGDGSRSTTATSSSSGVGGGWWCDAVDPRTGMALSGGRGARWSEVAAAHALLGYERRDAGICPVVLHPLHGGSWWVCS